MPYERLHQPADSYVGASAIDWGVAVKRTTTKDEVILSTVNTEDAFGITAATGATAGGIVAVHWGGGNEVIALAGASLGAGADVGVASTNGTLGPVAAASGVRKYTLGKSTSAAAAGAYFTVQLRPRELTGVAY